MLNSSICYDNWQNAISQRKKYIEDKEKLSKLQGIISNTSEIVSPIDSILVSDVRSKIEVSMVG